jgi:hypothetical protein
MGRNTAELAEGGKVLILPVVAGAIIQDGTLVVLDANGNAKAATKAEGLTAVGRAEEYADNTGGTAGAITVKVRRGVFVWDNTTVAANKIKPEHVMKDCYIVDDCTVTALATGSSRAGKVIAVTDDGIAVETI